MVSVDTPEDNKAFAEKEHADFVMLSDPTRRRGGRLRRAAARRARLSPTRRVRQRWTFYIGPDGKILLIRKGRREPDQKAGETMLAHLKELGIPEKRSSRYSMTTTSWSSIASPITRGATPLGLRSRFLARSGRVARSLCSLALCERQVFRPASTRHSTITTSWSSIASTRRPPCRSTPRPLSFCPPPATAPIPAGSAPAISPSRRTVRPESIRRAARATWLRW